MHQRYGHTLWYRCDALCPPHPFSREKCCRPPAQRATSVCAKGVNWQKKPPANNALPFARVFFARRSESWFAGHFSLATFPIASALVCVATRVRRPLPPRRASSRANIDLPAAGLRGAAPRRGGRHVGRRTWQACAPVSMVTQTKAKRKKASKHARRQARAQQERAYLARCELAEGDRVAKRGRGLVDFNAFFERHV